MKCYRPIRLKKTCWISLADAGAVCGLHLFQTKSAGIVDRHGVSNSASVLLPIVINGRKRFRDPPF